LNFLDRFFLKILKYQRS